MSPIARLLGEVFDSPSLQPPPAALPVLTTTGAAPRRRKKLWDIQGRWHCPLVGTCLPVAEMRKLSRRAGLDAAEMSDYTLHTVIVGHCGENCDIAKRVQRFFDERFADAMARFGRVRGEAAVLERWGQAMATGDVAGPLWAAWSHPDLTEDGGKAIYGDIHMLSHQAGATARADLRRLEQLAQENASLRDEAMALRLGLTEAERQRDRTRADLERRLMDAETRAAQLPRRELELAEALRSARDYVNLRERAEGLSRRIETLEERNAANARRANALELALAEADAELAAAESALESALGPCEGIAGAAGCGRACPAETQLAGRCVLCIGGRTGMVDRYRRLVEASGGRFLHHDGGEEQSLHRIDGAVSSADVVLCQSGCVSHAAYWRLKEACKKLGKPCVFVQSQGLSSFARGMAALVGDGAAPAAIARLAGRPAADNA